MKNMTKLLIVSLVVYTLGIVYTVHWGGLWLFLTFVFVLGLGYDIHSYIRLRKGKPILTYRGIMNYYKNKKEFK